MDNWMIGLALLVGITALFFWMHRGGGMGCCGGSHPHNPSGKGNEHEEKQPGCH